MLIHTFPPRRMCRVIAIRAASICRLVTYACSRAWIPYSPNDTWVPPVALPVRCGRCCLRCLTLRGMSMSSAFLAGGRALRGTTPRTLRVPWPLGPLLGRSPQRGLLRLAAGPAGRRLALVDPDLHADPAEGSAGLVEAVVDVGPQRVQRDAALAVELRPRHLRAAQAARALDPDPLGAALHRALDRLAHGPPERHPAGQLLGDALRDQLGVDLGVLHLEDVQLDLLGGQLLQVTADAVRFGAAAADDDTRPGGVDVHPHPVPGPLDLDLGDAGPLHATLQHAADGHVLGHVLLVQLVGVPAALEVGGDAEPEPVRVHFLSH